MAELPETALLLGPAAATCRLLYREPVELTHRGFYSLRRLLGWKIAYARKACVSWKVKGVLAIHLLESWLCCDAFGLSFLVLTLLESHLFGLGFHQ